MNVGDGISIDTVLNRVSPEDNVRKCFDPRLCVAPKYVAGPLDNGGRKTAYLVNNRYTYQWRPTGPRPHILPGSDVGFRNLYLLVDPGEVSLLGTTYGTNDIIESLSKFLSQFQVDLKGHIITTKDMIHFYCCLLTFVENKILKVCGQSILKNHTVAPHMVYYFQDVSNDGITIKSVDNITPSTFENLGNVMDLLNSRISTHHIKYNIVEAKR